MKMRLFLCSFLFLFSSYCVSDFQPTSEYGSQQVRGWKVMVSNTLKNDHKQLYRQAMELLDKQLYQIERVVPAEPLSKMKSVMIWLEYNNVEHGAAVYHPSKQWLINNDYNPDKAGCVEISNATNFLKWTISQPWMVLHEMSHAYHHQVIGWDNKKGINKEILDHFEKIKNTDKYQSVLHVNGRKVKAYALNNHKEYFAETSEAYFGTNDMYPFVRSELKEYDPEMYRIHEKIWRKAKPAGTSANRDMKIKKKPK